jgi:uncharacterized protein (TIGR02466 family)
MEAKETRRLFGLPVHAGPIEGFDDRRAELVAMLTSLMEKEAGIQLTNRGGGWHSKNDLHLRDDPSARWLGEALTTFCDRALEGAYPGRVARTRLTECWANVCGKGAWHTPHDHFPAHWSGVLYVAARHCLADADDDRAGRLELMNPIPLARAFGQPAGILYEPIDGGIVLFPGALQHFVHPNPSHELRISVSFNVVVSAE